MKIVILIHQIIQENFAYGEFFMLVIIGYIFVFRMVKKNAKFRFRNSSWVNPPLKGRVKSEYGNFLTIYTILHQNLTTKQNKK